MQKLLIRWKMCIGIYKRFNNPKLGSWNSINLNVGYKIKIVMSGTNEAKSPRFKDLRTIAVA